ncbi:MAG: JAB domain-containing protein [Candidatus Daviesbacteria bacterium]|nr:JAB domain-containing protein [Candidatus Daviesbacteria bacterium]
MVKKSSTKLKSFKGINIIPNYCIVPRNKNIPETVIKSPEDAVSLLRETSGSDRELLTVMYLDQRNRVLDIATESVGGRSSAMVTPENIFRGALVRNASSIIMSHNHPSGDPSPSEDDKSSCRALKRVGKELGIVVSDCLVIGKDGFTSFND